MQGFPVNIGGLGFEFNAKPLKGFIERFRFRERSCQGPNSDQLRRQSPFVCNGLHFAGEFGLELFNFEIDHHIATKVQMIPFYDRSTMILHAVNTLKSALLEEILLVTLAHVIFLGHFRSILIVTLPLPLAVLGSFLFMHYADISSNIMSLGGIAIAIGVLVDAGIVMTENVLRHAERYYEEHGEYQSAPPGYYIEWSGQYENQISAKKRLELVIPVVFVIIFLLLYKTYNSFKEAWHVILAVPFALSGGVFLLKLLGYNFSVAVWVGFIALFGTAVQTGGVMVIYLEEAVERKRVAMGGLTVQGLREAVTEGALLRLRPKIMTVSTVVAGLLPIMWSTRIGAEVMKPLATPVLGGMVSSLLHVLIVTPVIFTWLRERQLSQIKTTPAL